MLYALYFIGAVLFTLKTYPAMQDFPTYYLGRVFGVLTLSALALQPLLSSRARFLDVGIGLDRLSRWHSFNGKLVFLFALSHPALLFWSQLTNLKFTFLRSFTLYHLFGIAAMLGVLFIVVTAIYSAKLNLKFNRCFEI